MWRVVVLLAAGCGRQINPAWCAQPGHSDPACDEVIDARLGADTLDASSPDGAVPDASCPDGGCLDPETVLYASPTGAGAACTIDAKCSLPTAITQARPGRNLILLDPGSYLGAITIDQARDVRLVGPPPPQSRATLGPATVGAAGPIVTVTDNNARLELTRVAITGATGASGLSCVTGAVSAHDVQIFGNARGIDSACTLTLERSVVHTNASGALELTAGAIDIHDNFVVNNGDDKLSESNVTIASGVTGAFVFNTVAYNEAKQNTIPGVDCQVSAPGALRLVGNLITDNRQRGTFDVEQVMGTCNFAGSYVARSVGGNDVGWAIPGADFHLTAASTQALDQRPASECEGRLDIDGASRPLDGACDFGADELKR